MEAELQITEALKNYIALPKEEREKIELKAMNKLGNYMLAHPDPLMEEVPAYIINLGNALEKQMKKDLIKNN